MARDDLHKRIAELNKQPLKNVPAAPDSDIGGLRRKLKKQADAKLEKLAQENAIFPLSKAPVPASKDQPLVYSRMTPNTRARRSGAHSCLDDCGPAIALEAAVEGAHLDAPVGPGYYHIELPASDLEPCACDMHSCFLPLLGDTSCKACERLVAACKTEQIAPKDVVFLDLETTGLSMTPVFLIGTMECTSGGFVFKQYLARDYSEEISILSAFSERLGNAGMIVTFNGKSFDLPYLKNRATATGVKLQRPKAHLDLLHEARRHYGRSTPNHKLQTLERMVCGRGREDDIPGAEIPAAYHEFVRTGNANKMKRILEHNLHDLLTMADLMGRMWGRR